MRWAYNDADLVTSYTLAHLGVTFNYTYNARNELTGESTTGNSGGVPPAYANQLGGPPTGLESLPSVTAGTRPGGILAVPAFNATYVVDPAGNRKSQIVNGITTTYELNALSQVTRQTSSNGRTADHVYDEFGNETRRTTVQGGVTTEETFGYNHMNLWSTYIKKVGGVVQVNQVRTYTPDGQLVEDWDQKPATPMARVYMPRMGEVKTEYTRPSGGAPTLAGSYLGLGLDGKCTQITAGGVRTHTVGDLVGTVGMTLSDAGVPQVTSVKSAFGLNIASQGALPASMAGIAGSWLASNTDFSFLRNRFYDPSMGRFTQRDPIGMNYLYASHNPLTRLDPLGLADVCDRCGQRACYGCGSVKGKVLNFLSDFGGGSWRGIKSGDAGEILIGSVKGSSKFLGGMLRTGLYDSWAQAFDEDAAKRIEKAQTSFGLAWADDGVYGILLKPVVDDFKGGIEAYANGDTDGAGQRWGSGGIQVYMMGKGGYQGIKGGFKFYTCVKQVGLPNTLRAVGSGLRQWATTIDYSFKGNVGIKNPFAAPPAEVSGPRLLFGNEWYQYFRAKYGAQNVEWVNGVPEFVEGGPTQGVLVTAQGEYTLTSGAAGGPSGSFPAGTIPGRNGTLLYHVEAHAAALLRQQGLTQGTLYINRQPCVWGVKNGCSNMLDRMLPEGTDLRVVGPEGYERTFGR